MSIIHDALKKAQNGLQARTSSVIGRPAPAVPLKNSGTKNGGKIVVLILLVMAALPAEYMYLRARPLKHAVPTQEQPLIQVNAAPAPVPQPELKAGPESKAEPKVEPTDTPNIHGIMSNPKGNVVLIDNGIYAEGDEVQGVKIIKISLDRIVILKDGKEETIRVKQH
jgi:type II secretory pathway component PulC